MGDSEKIHRSAAKAREERLGLALRANLRRRKRAGCGDHLDRKGDPEDEAGSREDKGDRGGGDP